jgi:hypothetical protein
MNVRRILVLMVLVGFAVGMSAVVAKADGTGDPQGKWQTPGSGGTPGVDDEFVLPPFGSGGFDGACTFNVVAPDTEDCVLKNQSNSNWTHATITSNDAIPCADISVTSNVFMIASCSNNESGDAVLSFKGVEYSTALNNLLNSAESLYEGSCVTPDLPTCTLPAIQTPLIEEPALEGNCNPIGGTFPGVPIGCDFDIQLGPGADDSGNWDSGASFSVVAPEPSEFALSVLGLGLVAILGYKRKHLLGAE